MSDLSLERLGVALLGLCLSDGWISAASDDAKQSGGLTSGLINCPRRSMATNGEISLATIDPIPDQIEWRLELASNSKPNQGGVPEHGVDWEPIHDLLANLGNHRRP